MKRTVGLILSLIMLFAVSKDTNAATTILLGRNIDSYGKIEYDGAKDSGHIDDNLISLTYVGKVKLVISNQFGDFWGNTGKEHIEFLDIQAGYPVVNDKSGILYLTLTGVKYSGYLNNYTPYLNKHEADGGLIGFEMIGFPTDKIQFELGLHRSICGSYRINDYNLELEMTLLKLKIQYLLTDNLGLVIYTQLRDFDNTSITSEEIDSTIIGFIYRL